MRVIGAIICFVAALLLIGSMLAVSTSRRTLAGALAVGLAMFFGGCLIALFGTYLLVGWQA